jgi:hypothetical protein
MDVGTVPACAPRAPNSLATGAVRALLSALFTPAAPEGIHCALAEQLNCSARARVGPRERVSSAESVRFIRWAAIPRHCVISTA